METPESPKGIVMVLEEGEEEGKATIGAQIDAAALHVDQRWRPRGSKRRCRRATYTSRVPDEPGKGQGHTTVVAAHAQMCVPCRVRETGDGASWGERPWPWACEGRND